MKVNWFFELFLSKEAREVRRIVGKLRKAVEAEQSDLVPPIYEIELDMPDWGKLHDLLVKLEPGE